MKRALLGFCAVAILAVPLQARAQDRGYIRGLFGGTFGQVGGGAIGVGVGVQTSKDIQVMGEFGRFSNVIPKTVAEEIDRTAATLANQVTPGGKASSASSATANYGMFGVRVNVRPISGGMAFVEGGGGVANVKSKVNASYRSLTTQGDLSGQVSTSFTRATPETKPMVAVGAGVVLTVGKKAAIEMGYRFASIMTTGTKINTSKLYGALRFGF